LRSASECQGFADAGAGTGNPDFFPFETGHRIQK
jgi:hypothetical protein